MLLAIETSCDDSAVALLDERGKVLYNQITSQIEFHEKYGGIVPEIASRKHLTTLPPIVEDCFRTCGIGLKDLSAVAVTCTPGLIGSLLVGVAYGRTLAWLAEVPMIGVDHLEGHLLSAFLDHEDLQFPFLALVVSGGHTHFFDARDYGDYLLVGRTMDDAAGEAYDKVAKMLGFKYPGGPVIDKIALEFEHPNIEFPVPLKGKKTLNFSFSGLKTAVRNELIKNNCLASSKSLKDLDELAEIWDEERLFHVKNIAASFQKVMEKILTQRIDQALKLTGLKRVVVTGGVASNQGIRKSVEALALKRKLACYFPGKIHCTDNAAMIGYAAFHHIRRGGVNKEKNLEVGAKSPLGTMAVPPIETLGRNQ